MENPEKTATTVKPKKADKTSTKTTKMLDANQSLQIEVVSLQAQLLKEQELSMNLQQVVVELRRELFQLRSGMSAQANDKLIADLGLQGDVKLTKMPDGRYQAEF